MFVPDGLWQLLGSTSTLAARLQSVLEFVEPPFAVGNFTLEGLFVGDENLGQLLVSRGVFEPADVDLFRFGNEADGGFHPCVLPVQLTDRRVEDAVVCAEAVPDEIPVVVTTEPVDAKDRRRLWRLLGDVQPLLSVVTNVEGDEGAVRHGVVAGLLPNGGCGWLTELAQGMVDGLVP